MYQTSRLNRFMKGLPHLTREQYGLMANGPGAADATFMPAATGTGQEKAILTYAEHGYTKDAVTHGIEDIGIKSATQPPSPLKGEQNSKALSIK